MINKNIIQQKHYTNPTLNPNNKKTTTTITHNPEQKDYHIKNKTPPTKIKPKPP